MNTPSSCCKTVMLTVFGAFGGWKVRGFARRSCASQVRHLLGPSQIFYFLFHVSLLAASQRRSQTDANRVAPPAVLRTIASQFGWLSSQQNGKLFRLLILLCILHTYTLHVAFHGAILKLHAFLRCAVHCWQAWCARLLLPCWLSQQHSLRSGLLVKCMACGQQSACVRCV